MVFECVPPPIRLSPLVLHTHELRWLCPTMDGRNKMHTYTSGLHTRLIYIHMITSVEGSRGGP